MTLAILAAVAFIGTKLSQTYRFDLALLGIGLMAMNAVGAISPLHWYRRANPIRIYFISMGIRLLAVGAFTIALVLPENFGMHDAMSFVLTAMVAFVAFTGLEVRHMIRNQMTLLSTP